MGVSDALTIQGLDELLERVDSVPKNFPEQKKAVLEELGGRIEDEVQAQVSVQGVRDSRGRVSGWQRLEVGDKGGYVAVRPVKEKVPGRDINSRQLTGYLEKGHGLPKGYGAAGAEQGKRSGINDRTGLGYVSGFYFYSFARLRLGMSLRRYAKQAAEQLLREAAERIAGREA